MVEYNLAKVNVEGSNPFFCFYFLIILYKYKMDPKAVFGISIKYNTGIIVKESTF